MIRFLGKSISLVFVLASAIAAGQESKEVLRTVGTAAASALPPSRDAATLLAREGEVRFHLVIRERVAIGDYTVTEIRRELQGHARTILLVGDAEGGRYLLTSDRNYEKHVDVYEIRELGGREFLRMTLSTPSAATSASRLVEGRQNHPAASEEEPRFEYTTAGNGPVGGVVSHWRDPETARQWRSRIRSMLAPQFLETLEDMYSSGFIQTAAPEFASRFLDDIMYRNHCEPPALPSASAVGDCAFDKSFGFPCSGKQLERVGNAHGLKAAGTKGSEAKPY